MTDTNDSSGDNQPPTLEELLRTESSDDESPGEDDGAADEPTPDEGPAAADGPGASGATGNSELDELLAEVGATGAPEFGESEEGAADGETPAEATDEAEPAGDAAAADLLAAADAASQRTAAEQEAAAAAAAATTAPDPGAGGSDTTTNAVPPAADDAAESSTDAAQAGPSDDGTPDDDEDLLVVQYPSADFPPTPAFRLNIPLDWVALAATQAEMVVRAPEPIDGYHANVIVNSRRVPPAEDPAAALAASVDNEFQRSGYEIIESVGKEHDVTPAHAATVRFTTPSDTHVEAHQLHVYVPSSERSAHVLSVTGTVAANAPDDLRAGLLRVVRSLRLAAPDARSTS